MVHISLPENHRSFFWIFIVMGSSWGLFQSTFLQLDQFGHLKINSINKNSKIQLKKDTNQMYSITFGCKLPKITPVSLLYHQLKWEIKGSLWKVKETIWRCIQFFSKWSNYFSIVSLILPRYFFQCVNFCKHDSRT